MPILFSAVTRGSQILTKFASCSGNFTEAVHQILPKIPPEDKKFTYAVENFMIHYIAENKLVYLCITDSKFPRPSAFLFLDEIKAKFLAQFGDTSLDTATNTVVNEQNESAFDKILQASTTQYNNNKVTVRKVRADFDELKTIMVKTLNNAADRGARLETLIDRTDELAANTNSFRRTAVEVQRKYWWQNIRMQIIMVAVLAVVVYGGVSAACGGLKWPKCV